MVIRPSMAHEISRNYKRISTAVSKRTDCRTESKNTAKEASKGYPNVTIRLVREPK